MDYRNFVKRAAKELPWITDFVLERNEEITSAQMWAIALGYTNLADGGQDPLVAGWNDWLEFGRQIEGYPIIEIE